MKTFIKQIQNTKSLCSGEPGGVTVLMTLLHEVCSIWVNKVNPSFPAFIKYVCLESQKKVNFSITKISCITLNQSVKVGDPWLSHFLVMALLLATNITLNN